MLQACLNGARSPAEHSALPVTAAQLAADARAAAAAGADAVHLHVKDDHGADTLDAAALAAALTAVRSAAPGLPVGVSTGAWAVPEPDRRVAAIRAWGALPAPPDFASVNWHEPGAERVATALLDLGTEIEAGLWHAAAAESWARWPDRARCVRVLLELPDGIDPAQVEASAQHLLDLVTSSGPPDSPPALLHGEGTSAWPALRLAGRLGLSTRIGLEDVLLLPDGSPAADNAALVSAARAELGSP